MKLTRKWLLIMTAGLGILLIVYSLVRHFFDIGLSDRAEKYMMDGVIIAALGLFMYNRKLARDEKQAKEAAEAAEAARQAEPEQDLSEEDETLPHWERYKKTTAAEDGSSGEED
ncbi:MAG: hypothetical protein LBK77_00395 [Spirochaetaceae bacterium]|jgi:hypothetical protein|nr:hypothetical protein [Spirochaetaceae bacterium]